MQLCCGYYSVPPCTSFEVNVYKNLTEFKLSDRLIYHTAMAYIFLSDLNVKAIIKMKKNNAFWWGKKLDLSTWILRWQAQSRGAFSLRRGLANIRVFERNYIYDKLTAQRDKTYDFQQWRQTSKKPEQRYLLIEKLYGRIKRRQSHK